MEKTKRLITLLLAVLCALALCVPAFAADVTVITDMKTDCLVDASGSCQITQTVTIDIAGTEDTIELPLAANAKKISVAGYKYKKTTQDGYTVLVLSSNGGFSGSRTFTILYPDADPAAAGAQMELGDQQLRFYHLASRRL